jgi:hypothetical protein
MESDAWIDTLLTTNYVYRNTAASNDRRFSEIGIRDERELNEGGRDGRQDFGGERGPCP